MPGGSNSQLTHILRMTNGNILEGIGIEIMAKAQIFSEEFWPLSRELRLELTEVDHESVCGIGCF